MKSIVIYGTGKHGRIVKEFVEKWGNGEYKIEAFVETIPKSDIFWEYQVIAPEKIDISNISYIVTATVKYENEMKKRLSEVFGKDVAQLVVSEYDFMKMLHEFIPLYKITTTDNGISYIATNTDMCISEMMNKTGRNFSDTMIDYFSDVIDLDKDNANGIFLDIGANIGTTSIYIKKKYPNMKVIGFEAGEKNYKLFKANCILNDVEDIEARQVALSHKNEKLIFLYNEENPGASFCEGAYRIESKKRVEIEAIKLDDYVEQSGLDIHLIKCIWIDVEGMEASVLLGAKKLLCETKIPICLEFNPRRYIELGVVEEFSNLIRENYTCIIDLNELQNGIPKSQSINEIDKYIRENKNTDLILI